MTVSLILQATYWRAVLGYAGEKKNVCQKQVTDEIFVNCVAIALHRSATQTDVQYKHYYNQLSVLLLVVFTTCVRSKGRMVHSIGE